MDLPAESPAFKKLEESELGQQVKKLIDLNRKLIALSAAEKQVRWSSSEVTVLLHQYDEMLKNLGFTNQELIELFPAARPWPTMLSLVEQCLAACGTLSRKKNLPNPKHLLVPQELTETLNNDELIFQLIQKTLINLCSEDRKEFITKHNFATKMVHELYAPLNKTPSFTSYSPAGSQEIIEFLFKLITDVNATLLQIDQKNRNVFHLAAELAPTFVLKKLCTLPEFDPNTKNSGNENMVHFAVKNCEDSNLKFLLTLPQGASLINEGTNEKRTPLHVAVLAKSLSKATLLVNAGADFNSGDLSGNTPLHLAGSEKWSYEKGAEMVTFLLSQQSIQTELQNSDHLTAYELSFVSPINWYIAVSFQQYYEESEHSFYDAELNSLNSFDLVLTALREGRGMILFNEYIKKFPEVLLEFSGPLGETIVQIINQGRVNNPGRSHIVQELLKTLSAELPQLFLTRSETGQTGIEQTLASFDWSSWRNLNDYSQGYDWSNLVHSDFFYYNTTPNERFYNFLNKMAIFAVVLYVVCAIGLQIDHGFNIKGNLICATIFAGALALYLFWINTSSRNRDELGAKLKQISLTILQTPVDKFKDLCLSSKETSDEELALLPVRKTENIEAIEPIHSHPAGMKFAHHHVKASDLPSNLDALENYLKKSKAIMNVESAGCINKFLGKLSVYKEQSPQPQEILNILDETFDANALSLFDQNFKSQLADFYSTINELCVEAGSYAPTRRYGTA